MRRSVILDTTATLLFDSVIALSLYFLFAGHNQPGGGFIGGLIAAAALCLRYVAEGMTSVRSIMAVRAWTVLSTGLVVAAAVALAPVVVGQPVLESTAWEWDIPLLGHLKVGTSTIFDTGVYLVVIGLLLMILEALGSESPTTSSVETDDRQPADASHGSAGR